MESGATPIVKDLVLVGGGHSHVTVLRRFGMKPLPGVRLTLISRDVHTPYSGMLPGLIAGHYDFDQTHIDLGPLARFARARLYHEEVTGIDLSGKRLLCRSRPPVPFDIVSINIGSTPSLASVAGSGDRVVPVKPINNFLGRWRQLEERLVSAASATRVGVVGAGAGGVELVLAARHRLRQLLAEASRSPDEIEFHLFSASSEILPTHNRRARARFDRILREQGVRVHLEARVSEVRGGTVICEDGRAFPLDEVLWVTQAGAASWLGESGLAVDERGFVEVGDTLESVSHAGVFAAGDVASMVDHPREKAGVFAVRQGPPLEENLRRALLGERLRPFVPQKKFLSLVSTGDRHAVASRANWSLEGRWVWRWKDWIDRRFMDRFNVLPEMETGAKTGLPPGLADQEVLAEISTAAMRCGGCGAKVGAGVLDRVLARLEPFARDDVVIGLGDPDDSAVVKPREGSVLVHTVDFLRALLEDPYIFGKVVANHSLGDIYAMGAEPQTALAIVVVPFAAEAKVEETLHQLLAGSLEILREARTSLVGGHTSEGAELALGFAVNGFADPGRLLRKSGMRPGDRLVLTKAIGTGTLFAADMRLKAKGRWITGAIESMVRSNADGAGILRRHEATACTDVTGFGLLGHLVEMTKASAADVELDLESVPLLDGAAETVRAGILSSLQPQNVRLRRALRDLESASEHPFYPLLFDPQTSGGLLASVPAEHAEACLDELREAGYDRAALVGTVLERGEDPRPISVIPAHCPAGERSIAP